MIHQPPPAPPFQGGEKAFRNSKYLTDLTLDMKSLIRRFIPKPLLNLYHFCLAKMAAFWYRYPSEKMMVAGITGTGGKSTTVYLLAKILEAAGKKVGATSTLFFKVGEREWLNDKKMTMLGRFQTQKLLATMVKNGCEIAIVETTSQGIEQYRHLGINYDIAVLTNLYPEHLEAHGGFENYKKAKGKLFAGLIKSRRKTFGPAKTIIVNGDDENADYFLSFPAERKFTFSVILTPRPESGGKNPLPINKGSFGPFDYRSGQALRPQDDIMGQPEKITATDLSITGQGIQFTINETNFNLPLLSQFNLYNTLCAVTIAQALGLSLSEIQKASQTITSIPGRLEFIDQGQPFKIIVDYAFEPRAMNGLYDIVKMVPHQKIVQVLGSAGGGRDKSRRPKLGEMAGEKADYVIVTNEDPYDENPQTIIDQVAAGAIVAGKRVEDNLFKILDRRVAIAKALSLARPGDLVLITGKGCEQAICVKNGKKVTWDDREVVKQELKKQLISHNFY